MCLLESWRAALAGGRHLTLSECAHLLTLCQKSPRRQQHAAGPHQRWPMQIMQGTSRASAHLTLFDLDKNVRHCNNSCILRGSCNFFSKYVLCKFNSICTMSLSPRLQDLTLKLEKMVAMVKKKNYGYGCD